MTRGRVLRAAGSALVALGVLVLLFAAYQLWGTWLLEAHHQSELRAQFEKELPRSAHAAAERLSRSPAHTTSGPPATAPPVDPPAVGQPLGLIDIPSIGVNQVVVEGVGVAQLATGPGHYPGTPLPGEVGNAAIAGHRTTHGRPFYNLQALVPGDQVDLTTAQGIFVFDVRQQSVVVPTDVSVLDPTPTAQLTLTTCNPRYSAAQRLVVHAALVRSLLFPAKPTTPPRHRHAAAPGTDALAGGTGSWWPAVLLGLATATVAVAGWWTARRVRRPVEVWLVAVPLTLVLLFAFYTALDPLLPASL